MEEVLVVVIYLLEWLVLIGIVRSIIKRVKKKKEKHIQDKAETFSEGQIDNTIIEFTDAYIILSNHHYDVCRYLLKPNGVHMWFQDYADDWIMRVLIEDNDAKAYLSVLDTLGDKHDSGWILRKFGHEGDHGYWECDINIAVSKETAAKVFEMLSKSSRLIVNRSDAAIEARKPSD